MFSLKACDELVFGTPTTSCEDMMIVDRSSSDTNLISFSATTKQLSRSRNECNIRRVIEHRDHERKRRQQMANLYDSLQSLLPVHPNKGKSSVCEQMKEAADYIKEMHKKIQELRSRRDKLKHCSSWGTNVESVAIHQVVDRLEILIRNKSSELKLSPVLAQLLEREIDVVTCVSTRTDAGFLHKIEIQAKDMKSLDVAVLYDRLTAASK